MNININCSIGEIIDKITILDIKCEEIKDESKLSDCKKERDSLLNNINHIYSFTIDYYRKILKKINKQIWDDQELIIKDNDSRFKVKKIINTYFNSELKEQKSYIEKTCVIISHLGLGDSINISPCVRYLSTIYDKLYVFVKDRNLENMKLMYSDNPFIECISVPHTDDNNVEINNVNRLINEYKLNGADMYRSGIHYSRGKNASNVWKYWAPKGFYIDMELDYEDIYLSREWFFCNDLVDKDILQQINKYKIIFIHKNSSSSSVNIIVEKNKHHLIKDDTIVIDACENQYIREIDNIKFKLADYFVYKPLAYYSVIIQECDEIYLTDSSIYCMTVQLKLKAVVKECYVRTRIEDVIKIDSRFNYYSI
jgi:hypothetical protein